MDLVGDQRERDSEQYCAEKYPLMQAVIARYFAQQDRDLEALIEANRARRATDGDIQMPTASAL